MPIWLRFGKENMRRVKIAGERSKNGGEWSWRKVAKFTVCILNCKIKGYFVVNFLNMTKNVKHKLCSEEVIT